MISMGIRVRTVTVDGVPYVALIASGGFMIAQDRTDTLRLIGDLQRELINLPPGVPDNEQGSD
jgi:hypothetical protein